MVRRFLLACGVLSSLLYAAMTMFVASQWDSYSSASQTISELSAIGAPTRSLWVGFGMVYTVLVALFGCGVWSAARGRTALRVAGAAIIALALIGLAWPPMHQRAVLAAGGGTLTDTLHIAWSAVAAALMLITMAFAASAFGRGFRIYSIVSIVALLGFGVLCGLDAPRLQANLPTPWIGVWERLSIGADMLWVAVLGITLLRRDAAAPVHARVGSLAA